MEDNLTDFYELCASFQIRRNLSLFGTTYLCKHTFPRVKFIKSKCKINLPDEHLKSLLVINTSKLEPEFNMIIFEDLMSIEVYKYTERGEDIKQWYI